MARVKGRDTAPERRVRSLLHRMGYRFRLHVAALPGKPDIVLAKHRTVVFVHGCFWHGHTGCARSRRPSSNRAFWNRKIDANIRRDARQRRELAAEGWRVMVIWECALRKPETTARRIRRFMTKGA